MDLEQIILEKNRIENLSDYNRLIEVFDKIGIDYEQKSTDDYRIIVVENTEFVFDWGDWFEETVGINS